MFNYPGSMPDNVKEGVDELRRWITKFIPELEQQLSNLGADNFSSAYNERLEGLTALSGAGQQKTTSEALAEHLLDRNNPHKVTLSQLGYVAPQLKVEEENGSLILTLCGLMIQLKPIVLEAGTATAEGRVYKRTVSAGDWEREFGALYGAVPVIKTGAAWLGGYEDADEEHAGTLTLYSAEAAAAAGAATMIGIGRE